MPTFQNIGGKISRSQPALAAPGRPAGWNMGPCCHPRGNSALRRGTPIREYSPRGGPVQSFRRTVTKATWVISGQTLDSAGAPLASCLVDVFYDGSDMLVVQTVSDGSGNYSVTVPTNSPMYARATNAAGTVCGCTLTLSPTEQR